MSNEMMFSKMQGLGNDFVIIDNIRQTLSLSDLPSIIKLADRHFGIGFDQLFFVTKNNEDEFFCHIFNADGSEAEQCGNGMRCVSRYLCEKKLTNKREFTLTTKSGSILAQVPDFKNIQVEMGKPLFEKENQLITIDDNQKIVFAFVSMFNPHAIIKVDDLSQCSITKIGKQVSEHSFFPNGTNVGFMEVVSKHKIKLRTYERGAGETFACGSNACAAAVAGINWGLLDKDVEVNFKFGHLNISWEGNDSVLRMNGSAEQVFDGVLRIT